MKPMNILVTVNDNYIRPLQVMLDSLMFHNKESITLYLVYSNIKKENLDKISIQLEQTGNQFIPVVVSEDYFKGAPVFRYFTKEMYYRLLCSHLIPKEEERILYLDPDILIRGSLKPLYETDFQGRQVVGIPDLCINEMTPEFKDAVGIPREVSYINSGVLLFNLQEMRKRFVLEDLFRVLDTLKEAVSFPDQDIINVYFKDDIIYADRVFNYNTGYGSIKSFIKYVFSKKERQKDNPVIVHYMGGSKPWQLPYYGKFYKEYYPFLKPYLTEKERKQFRVKGWFVLKNLAKTAIKKIKKKGEAKQHE